MKCLLFHVAVFYLISLCQTCLIKPTAATCYVYTCHVFVLVIIHIWVCLRGHCSHLCKAPDTVHWLQGQWQLSLSVSLIRVIRVSLFCLSAQTPVVWLRCFLWDQVALLREGRRSSDKINKNASADCEPGKSGCIVYVDAQVCVCLCVCSPLYHPSSIFGIAVSKSHSSE